MTPEETKAALDDLQARVFRLEALLSTEELPPTLEESHMAFVGRIRREEG